MAQRDAEGERRRSGVQGVSAGSGRQAGQGRSAAGNRGEAGRGGSTEHRGTRPVADRRGGTGSSGAQRASSAGQGPRQARAPRVEDPAIPDSIQVEMLDRVTRNSLRTLPDGLAEIVARHLAAAAAVVAEDPELALRHAMAASRRAGRVAVVREAVGVAAYANGEYAQALSELRAAGRISGSLEYLPMMADCERGLGKPERALAMASLPEVANLPTDARVEMLIVAAGARRDLGDVDAAVLTLQVPALRANSRGEWLARLRYAYADALVAAGRQEEARTWFARVVEVDPEGLTDAAERLDELAGVTFAQSDGSDGGPDSGGGAP
jgi:tetratricopeptide (TPR) repeat protein